MAELLLGGGHAPVDLVGRVGAAAREATPQFGAVADADEDRDERGGEPRVGGALGADRRGALDVDVQERIETGPEMGRDVGRARPVEVAVDVGVLEEDTGGDLLFEARRA